MTKREIENNCGSLGYCLQLFPLNYREELCYLCVCVDVSVWEGNINIYALCVESPKTILAFMSQVTSTWFSLFCLKMESLISPPNTEITSIHYHTLAFVTGFWQLISHPPVCKASTSATKPSSQPITAFITSCDFVELPTEAPIASKCGNDVFSFPQWNVLHQGRDTLPVLSWNLESW